MKYSLIFLAMLTLNACAPKLKDKVLSIDSKFQPYVNSFISIAEKEGHPVSIDNLIIQLDPTMTGPVDGSSSWILGTCTSGENPTIRINPVFWNGGYSISDKEQLLFHELGHCILFLAHNSARIGAADASFALDASIMNPYHMSTTYYNINHEYYMKELFGVRILPSLYAYGTSQFDGTPYASTASAFSSNSSSYDSKVEEGTVTTTRAVGIQYDEEGNPTLAGILCGDED